MAQASPETTTTTAALLAGYLHAAGVRHVFGYPGESVIDFMEAARHRDIAVVCAVREGTAAFMAEATAAASGRPGVCLSTLGPGSTAVLNGVASATLDRVPVLAVSGQIESSREQFFTHQVVDHDRMFAPVSKLALRLDPASADTVIRKALRTAVAERPGAVHLTVTADAWSVPAEGQVSLPPLAPAAASVEVHGDGAGRGDGVRRCPGGQPGGPGEGPIRLCRPLPPPRRRSPRRPRPVRSPVLTAQSACPALLNSRR
jgi:acetolactate synthase-1/2/3 large subunit